MSDVPTDGQPSSAGVAARAAGGGTASNHAQGREEHWKGAQRPGREFSCRLIYEKGWWCRRTAGIAMLVA